MRGEEREEMGHIPVRQIGKMFRRKVWRDTKEPLFSRQVEKYFVIILQLPKKKVAKKKTLAHGFSTQHSRDSRVE